MANMSLIPDENGRNLMSKKMALWCVLNEKGKN